MENKEITSYEDYIGKEIKGFKFEKRSSISYVKRMDKKLGEIGIILEYYKERNDFEVKYSDGVIWFYPADEAINHLVKKELIQEQDPCNFCGRTLRQQMKGCLVIGCYRQFIHKQETLKEPKVYTCKDLSDGRVACVNDGTIEEFEKVAQYCFPKDELKFSKNEDSKYLTKFGGNEYESLLTDAIRTDLPTQSVKVFLQEIKEKEIANHIDKLEETKQFIECKCTNALQAANCIINCLNKIKPEPKQIDPLKETPFHKPDFSHLKEKVDKDGFTNFKNLFAFRRLEIEEIESSAFYSSIFKKDDLDKLVAEGVFIDKLSGQKYTLDKPKLYSILLTYRPTNISIVFIDQTEEEIKDLKEHYNEYHSIVVEQDQDKGILIQVKC